MHIGKHLNQEQSMNNQIYVSWSELDRLWHDSKKANSILT